MAAERPVTPEKQLLKLIEEHKAQKGAGGIQAQAIKHRNLSLLNFGAWLGRFSFSKDWLRKRAHHTKGHQLDVKLVNGILLLLIYILGAYFVISFSSSFMRLSQAPSLEVKTQESAPPLNLTQKMFLKKTVSYYLEKIRDRDIFRMGSVRVMGTGADGLQTVMKVTSSKVLEATQNLKLVGISWSRDPDAIIEDTKTTKTFFVKTGQMVGDVKVQAIFKDKVILSFGGEEMELR